MAKSKGSCAWTVSEIQGLHRALRHLDPGPGGLQEVPEDPPVGLQVVDDEGLDSCQIDSVPGLGQGSKVLIDGEGRG